MDFFRRGGTIELVASPVLSNRDICAMREGLYEGRAWERRSLEDIVRAPRPNRASGLLAWAVATRRLEVRIAIVTSGNPQAIYHEKIGVFLTGAGDVLAFEGSANESANAYVENYERLFVHDGARNGAAPSWADLVRQNFEDLWENRTPGVDVLTLHDALKRKLMRPRRDTMPLQSESDPGAIDTVSTGPSEILRRPSRMELREYQGEAILAWFRNKGCGIFAMATGTGKTVTAFALMEELFRKVGSPLVIIVVAPYLGLVRQWIAVAKTFGLDPINCSGTRNSWVEAVEAAIYLVSSGNRPLLSLVTTNSTFAETPFQGVLDRLQVRTLLVADEVHNLGARALQASLPERVQLRLGLSATPERWMDEDGTAAIQDYFGDVVFQLDLEEALKLQPPVLTPYTYHPVLVYLEEDEREEYLRITRMLSRFINDPKGENLSDVALGLLLKRARLVACARQKLPALASAITPYRDTRYNLVYCGDGRMEVEPVSKKAASEVPEVEVLRQVEAVAKLLGQRMEMNVALYTADTPDDERQAILRDFEAGNKHALVAIRCLDEGVDIPQVRRAFILASSTNPRQFIQRRGRVLRRADGKDNAEIFDFIVVPPLEAVNPGTAEFRVMRSLVEKEMRRVVEFARLARNGPQAHAKLLPILSTLRLMHL